jgi:hypothetical protein
VTRLLWLNIVLTVYVAVVASIVLVLLLLEVT